MSVPEIILGVLLLVASIFMVFVVLLQEGRSAGISGAIAGGAESFLGKNKGRTIGARLQKWTKTIAILFFVLILAANVVLVMSGVISATDETTTTPATTEPTSNSLPLDGGR